MKLELDVPEVPESLNPKGWEVQLSVLGQKQEGDWPLGYGWECRQWSDGYIADRSYQLRARLVPPVQPAYRDMPIEWGNYPQCKHPSDKNCNIMVTNTPLGFTNHDWTLVGFVYTAIPNGLLTNPVVWDHLAENGRTCNCDKWDTGSVPIRATHARFVYTGTEAQ